MQDQVDAALAIGARAQVYAVDEAIEERARRWHGLKIAGSDHGDVRQLAAVVFDDGGVGDHRFDFRELDLFGQQGLAPACEFVRTGLQLIGRDACDDGVGDPFFSLVDLGQLALQIGAAAQDALALFGPGEAKFFEICGDDVGVQQLAIDGRPHPALQHRIGDRCPVGAGASLAIGAAAPAIGRDDDHRRAAASAADLAGEQPLLPVALRACTALGIEPLLHLRPDIIADDLQIGHRLVHLVFGLVEAGDPLAAVRVFPEGLPVIDDFADVEPVVQDPVAALAVADDRIGAPEPAARGGDAFIVELLGDGSRAAPGGVFGKDAADDGSLFIVDLAQAPLELTIGSEGADLAIAVGKPAGDAAGADPANMTATDLLCQLFKEHGGHGAAEPDVHRADVAFGQCHDPRACEPHPFEDARQILLIARDAIEAFGKEDLRLPCVDRGNGAAQAGPIADRAADRGVGFLAQDAPALALGALAEEAQLIFDRVLGLQGGRVARVEDCSGHSRLAESFSRACIMARTRRLAKSRAKAIASGAAAEPLRASKSSKAKAGGGFTVRPS